MMRCPRCSELLGRKRVGAVELDGCHACGGAFFDAGELSTLARDPVQLAEVDRAFQAIERPLKPNSTDACPKCSVPLVRFEQPSLPGIELDACRTCRGIWLDGGEATEIARRRGLVVPAREVAAPESPQPVPPAAKSNPRQLLGMAVAGITFVAALATAGHSVALLSRERASGRVVSVQRTWLSRRHWQSDVTVAFDAGGQHFTIRRHIPQFSVVNAGDPVEVLYAPDDPFDGTLDLFWQLWDVPLFLLILGAVATARILGITFR